MKVSARLNNLRISPRKVRLIADLIKGQEALEAVNQLNMNVKAGNEQVRKLLESAIANAENNFGLDKTNLYVFSVVVEAGATLKRWMPKAYGRAGAIRKRTCKVIITLEERVEGKGRKSQEQMEKEKKARLAEIKKREKEALANIEEGEKAEKKGKKIVEKVETEKVNKSDGKGNWAKKIFQRKSM